jgi:hypothetical protein
MPFTLQWQPLTRVFDAGALFTLADTMAAFISMYWSSGTLDGSVEQFPFISNSALSTCVRPVACEPNRLLCCRTSKHSTACTGG